MWKVEPSLISLSLMPVWDEIRVETATTKFVKTGTEAPRLPHDVKPISHEEYDDNVIDTYERSKH